MVGRGEVGPIKPKITSYSSVIMQVTQLKARFCNVWGKYHAILEGATLFQLHWACSSQEENGGLRDDNVGLTSN